jgi:predicted protein tyrosine phosphatase
LAAIFPIRITVCGFAELKGYGGVGVSHVLSLLDPGTPIPSELDRFGGPRRLELRFHDVIKELPYTKPPSIEDVEGILALGRELTAKRSESAHLLIHCHAGFSRSPAALALLVAQAAITARQRCRRRSPADPPLCVAKFPDH